MSVEGVAGPGGDSGNSNKILRTGDTSGSKIKHGDKVEWDQDLPIKILEVEIPTDFENWILPYEVLPVLDDNKN